MSLRCVTCDQKFETLPKDAVQLTEKRRITTYQFADGSVHSLRHDWTGGNITKSLHTRWHKTEKKLNCLHCYPPPEPSV